MDGNALQKQAMELLPSLNKHERISLGSTVSDFHRLPGASVALGVEIYAKRDDCLPLAMGGNKVRQLEYYLAPGAAFGADTVLITGAIQSNFVRLCAAAARKLGWKAIVQLEDRVPVNDTAYNTSGNVLLDRMLGADIRYFPEGENEAAADASLDAIARKVREAGGMPYVVHLGLQHPPLGALGYVLAAAEMYLQGKANGAVPDDVIIPTGSGLTHAGFLCGARAIGWKVRVHGICVRRDAIAQKDRIRQRALETSLLLEMPELISDDDILVYDSVLAPGYGQMNAAVSEALSSAAAWDALLLDPVYSGRGFAGMMNLIKTGTIQRHARVAFLHTGGLPSVFGYQNLMFDGPDT